MTRTLLAIVICAPLGACLKDEPHTPLVSCVLRETFSGACINTELRCPDPLIVAQKMDNRLFCKIKPDAKVHAEAAPPAAPLPGSPPSKPVATTAIQPPPKVGP